MEKSFLENINLSESHVNKVSNTISNVCVLTPISKNNRFYTDQSLQDCSRLVDRTKCFLNHGSGQIENIIGSFFGGEVRNGKVYSNLSILDSCIHKNLIFEIAETKSHLVGLSINGKGKFSDTVDSEGREVCESILELRSVDLVGFPACTNGLYEGMDQINLKEVNKRLLSENEQLRKDLKLFRDLYIKSRATIND